MNELILVDKIEKRLREKKEPPIFPLTPTHRRELRELRRANVGNLQDRLRTIKQLKGEEYTKKYFKRIKLELREKKKICEDLNSDWSDRIKKINELLISRQLLEKKYNLEFLNLNRNYGGLSDLNVIKGEDREFTFEEDKVSEQVAEKEFEEKYGESFRHVQKKIDDIITKYEEAINFGDLEIVKEIYYIMKKADSFFEKISKLRI